MFNLHNWHSFQIISALGIITAALVQITLFAVGKDIDRMWALYPTWLFFFTIGFFLRRKESASHAHDELHDSSVSSSQKP